MKAIVLTDSTTGDTKVWVPPKGEHLISSQQAFDTARAFQYLALALALGGLVFVFGPWFGGLRQTAGGSKAWEEASDAFAQRSRGIILGATALGILASIAGILLQGATAAGVSALSAAKPSTVQDVLGTDFGRIWGMRILVWALFGAAVIALYGFRAAPRLQPATHRYGPAAATPLISGSGEVSAVAAPPIMTGLAGSVTSST